MSLENLKKRLEYRGGNEEGRIRKDKVRSLKAAMHSSYQAATIYLPDEEDEEQYTRVFKCLINPDKTKENYNNMFLSIPFEDISLNEKPIGNETTTKGLTNTRIKPGQVFYWAEENSYWIIYMQHIEERAYFRAEIRKCEKQVVINGRTYKIYFRGPTETTISWGSKSDTIWNDLNYSAIVFITQDGNTLDYIKRFATLNIEGETYEVVARNTVAGDGIIKVALKETYTDTFPDPEPEEPEDNSLIKGDNLVYPYDIKVYTIEIENPAGVWSVNSSKVKIKKQDSNSVTLEIVTGKSGEFDLIYSQDGEDDIIQHIIIQSL